MNFRRPRNERHAMVMTHLARCYGPDRPLHAPRGGGEERDLVNFLKIYAVVRHSMYES